ncbi:hypothetical protein FNAPI_2143 [Fusarium napiforme]|uniref:Uncharacterized protein n=1 Tax=Fusarium napiforme TaxID=42672 RepID=A0A8H5JYU6_9HYPO|nr:hypothetical protein FNAPI_2143 [Fusarium napiforme]
MSHALHAVFPLVTKAPFLPQPSNILEPRAISTELSTCGYLDGDPKKKRTADSGFNCRVDTRNGLWGFCPTTVLTASDCGLAGSCVDRHDCSDGCGMTGSKGLTTFTCGRKSFCSMALLTFGVDQTYSYIACGTKATTDHYYITPTIGITTTSESSELSTSGTSRTTSVTSSDTVSSTTDITQSVSTESISSSSEEEDPSRNSSPNLGAIIGGVIGGLVVICASPLGKNPWVFSHLSQWPDGRFLTLANCDALTPKRQSRKVAFSLRSQVILQLRLCLANIPKKKVYDVYFTARNWHHRIFATRCKATLTPNKDGNFPDPFKEGPTATHLASVLLGMNEYDETNLPKEWHTLADWYPQYATILVLTLLTLAIQDAVNSAMPIHSQAAISQSVEAFMPPTLSLLISRKF